MKAAVVPSPSPELDQEEDLYVTYKNLEKQIEFLKVQEDYIKVWMSDVRQNELQNLIILDASIYL